MCLPCSSFASPKKRPIRHIHTNTRAHKQAWKGIERAGTKEENYVAVAFALCVVSACGAFIHEMKRTRRHARSCRLCIARKQPHYSACVCHTEAAPNSFIHAKSEFANRTLCFSSARISSCASCIADVLTKKKLLPTILAVGSDGEALWRREMYLQS